MKLAEALINRADAQKRVAQLEARLTRAAFVQEGDMPPEQPDVMLAELSRTLDEFERLVILINRTNAATQLEDGRTLTELLARRDRLIMERNVLNALSGQTSASNFRFTRSEIRMVMTIDVTALQRRVDELARSIRVLDTRIQQLNWTIDLME